LKKTPSISETLDWVRALTLLNIEQLDHDLVEQTLSTLAKYEADVRKASLELKAYLAERRLSRKCRQRKITCISLNLLCHEETDDCSCFELLLNLERAMLLNTEL
jgi:uncharacterized protein Smg (DUF494 family)